jgi:hypothetical protein
MVSSLEFAMDIKAERKVSPNNPCPFLRALVAEGLLDNRVATVGHATEVIERVAATGEGKPSLPSLAVRLVAVLSNGLSPGTVLETGLHGVKLSKLRNGPFDKKGAGSRILNSKAQVVPAELSRLKEFASLKTSKTGTRELGLNAKELETMMDANYERAGSRARLLDRQLMNGEWPVLLDVMGKDGMKGRYLSLREINSLFIKRELPSRMTRQLKVVSRAAAVRPKA